MDGRLPGTAELGQGKRNAEAAPPPPKAPSPIVKASSDGDAGGTAETRKVTKPIRPNDVADWKRDDYYSAKRDNDPRLVAAVGYLGEHFAGNQSAAELLARLLEAPATIRLPRIRGNVRRRQIRNSPRPSFPHWPSTAPRPPGKRSNASWPET